MDPGVLLNCILVMEDIRPSLMVQPIDYKEVNGKDLKTSKILSKIKELFPELIHSEEYEMYQGVLISKTSYDGRKDIDIHEMGKLLGYPCYQDKIDKNTSSYTIEVMAYTKIGMPIQLFANACKDDSLLEKFKQLADRATEAFTKHHDLLIREGIDIHHVSAEIEEFIPSAVVIDKLIKNIKLSENEILKIGNVFYNFGFERLTTDMIQFNNEIHKGIVLDLLIRDKNDTLSPFFPLQNYPEKDAEIHEITQSWENDIIDVLEKTKIRSGTKRLKCIKRCKSKKL